ncbi:MAG TPA: AI-2E family transporter [Pseudolabrys sp.]|nr:AI-2E family transporter [Pseudolabrys sp.]
MVDLTGQTPAVKGTARVDTRQATKERRFLLAINDPKPIAHVSTVWRTASQAAAIGIFMILFVAALDLARAMLLPATSAFVIGLMLGPLSARAKAYGIPSLITAIVLWLLVVVVFYGVIILLSAPALDWIGKAPEIGRIIKEKLQVLEQPLSALQDLRNAILPQGENSRFGFDIANFVQPALIVVTPAIGQIFIFFGTLFFFLLGRARLRHVIVILFENHDSRLRTLRIINDIERNLTNYLSVVAVINFVVGLGACLIAYFIGLPNPVAWGVLAFILNFIPYIGALIMEAVLLAVGLVTFPTLTQALIAPVLYFGFTTLEGHFITPSIMGRRLALAPLTVFLALIFWTWLWGPIGAFLAVPLLIVALVAINHLFPQEERVLPG